MAGKIHDRVRRKIVAFYNELRIAPEAPAAIRRAASAVKRERIAKQVVFVSDSPGSRQAKLAFGLKHNGWNVILLHKDPPNFNAGDYFESVHQYRSRWEALKLGAEFSPVVYHVFSSWNFTTSYAYIHNRPGRIVFDDYDVLAGMVKRKFFGFGLSRQLRLEKYCLENADGLCCRSLETQYAKRHLRYRFRGHRLLMLDCCWANSIPSSTCQKQPSAELHLAYVGNLMVSSKDDQRLDPAFVNFLRCLATHKIHLHIYPALAAWDKLSVNNRTYIIDLTYFENIYIHIHRPVPIENLLSLLQQYDGGIFDTSAFSDAFEQMYNRNKFIYASTNKLFDYMDAGLPVLINSTQFQEFLVRHYQLGKRLNDLTKLGRWDTLVQLDWPALRDRMMRSRSLFSVVNQAKRLVAFYESL